MTQTPPQPAAIGADGNEVGDWDTLSEDEIVALLVEPWWLDALDEPDPVPDPVAVAERVDELAQAVPSGRVLAELAGIDPAGLPRPLDRVAYLQAVDRARGYAEALAHTAIVALAGPEPCASPMSERQLEHEVAVARRCSNRAAGFALDTARTLLADFPATHQALARGEITPAHVRVLLDGTAQVTDAGIRAAVETRALPRASTMTPPRWARVVAAAVADLDVAEATDRHVRAVAERGVQVFRGQDGMGTLQLSDSWDKVNACYRALTRRARALQHERGGASAAAVDPNARLDACRADTMVQTLLSPTGPDGDANGTAPVGPILTGQLVISLETLTGAADLHALLDGQPIPAPLGRKLAAGITAWQRLVTAPVTGHLLDLGSTVYLNDEIRRFVFARDQICVAPGCGQPARAEPGGACQADHHLEHPEGPTASWNQGPLCAWHHQLKTAKLAFITPMDAEGCRTWTTGYGQTVLIPPRPILDTGQPPPPPPRRAPTPPDDDEPPF